MVNERDAATEALIREVDEDLKRDQFEKLWQAYGKYAVAAAALLILGVAGNELWQHRQRSLSQEESARFSAASQQAAQGRDAASLSGLEGLAKEGKTAYASLAAMKRAGFLAAQGEREKSAEAYQLAGTASNAEPLYQGSARLHALFLQIDQGDPARLEAELAPLAAANQPWRHSAQELQALLALRTGDNAKALDLLTRLSDDATAPQGLRARAAELRQALEAKGRS